MVDADVATATTTTENGEAAAPSDAPGTEGENEPRIPDDPIQKVYDEMLHRFLTEPERAVKIFLSSYFINKGLYWCVTEDPETVPSILLLTEYLAQASQPPANGSALHAGTRQLLAAT